MSIPVHYDRIYPIADASNYPGSEFCDLVFFLPRGGAKQPLRLWLKTKAEDARVMIDHFKFLPQGSSSNDDWYDLGMTEPGQTEEMRGFGHARIYGIEADEQDESYLLVTENLEDQPRGSIAETRRALFGIDRTDVGRTLISPSTIVVGTPTVFTVLWLGPHKGFDSSMLIRFTVPKAFAEPEIENGDCDGAFEIVDADFPIRAIWSGGSPESHEKWDVLLEAPDGIPPDSSVRVQYRTEFTYLFDSLFECVERRYWYSKLPPLSAAIARRDREIFVVPEKKGGHTVRFVPDSPMKLHLFMPGRRSSSENAELVGIITDAYRNLAATPLPYDFELTLEGNDNIPLGDASGHYTANYRFAVPLPDLDPGVYRVRACRKDNGDEIAVSNPFHLQCPDASFPNIYWGEIHAHSEMSDGSGDFRRMLRWAREVSVLDFAAPADHACYYTDNQWEWMQDVINSFNETGRFCTIIGYEWAGNQGHRNIYTSRDRLKLFRGMYQPTSDIGPVYGELEGDEAIVAGPHTGHTGDFWDSHNPDVERFIEIYSMWGIFEELACELLQNGAVLGFTGGGDCHEGRLFFSVQDPLGNGKRPHTFAAPLQYKCGITGAVMDELSREELISALRNRRTYATTGARILLDFAVSGISMGGTGTTPEPIVVSEIHTCRPIESVEIIRDGNCVHRSDGGGLDREIRWVDGEAQGRHWYYVRVEQVDGEIAWSSPVWVDIKDA
ncbi:MAG: CehA/McbA family metallohydrolase [Planctomycetes bacterium]|nr:CehA/McbA family metallohydrolase [Planctomycetota bacterium]